jgi:hypothetical protein
MKTTKVITVSLPIEWCEKLRERALKQSLKTGKQVTVSSYIKKALREKYFNEEIK